MIFMKQNVDTFITKIVNKLVKEMKESKDKKELKCVICNKDIVEYI